MEGLWLGYFLLTVLLVVRRCDGYDPEEACGYWNVSAGELQWIACPDNSTLPEQVQIPAYCCSIAGELPRECCVWSVYVINTAGFGSTGFGLVTFVFIFFLMSLVFVITVCAAFELVCRRPLERRQMRGTGSMRRRSGLAFSSRANSTREGARSSVGTVYTTDAEAQAHAIACHKDLEAEEKPHRAPIMF